MPVAWQELANVLFSSHFTALTDRSKVLEDVLFQRTTSCAEFKLMAGSV